MPGLIDQIAAALDARLSPASRRPIAVALSGGGDSMALLHLAADWARMRGRRLLALTVDHRLHPDSGAWTAFAGRAAASLGADWRALDWSGPKPATGLPAAARAARHALLADAARAAGAGVILMAHTADDVAEAEWMRGQGSTLGRLRPWSPSPVWPEGRGVMLLRPLLAVRRADLRTFLTARGATWLEDPANDDPRFLRARARAALSGEEAAAPFSAPAAPEVFARDQPLAWAGAVWAHRDVSHSGLAAALLSVSGGASPPRGGRIAALAARARTADAVTATLAGTRIQTEASGLLVARECGRAGLPQVALTLGEPLVWDGRFEITAAGPGLRVSALRGRMAALASADQAIVKRLPASARPSLPVLFRDEDPRPVLAWRAAETRCLVAGRLVAAVGGIGHEDDLNDAIGETPPPDLFLNPGEDIRSRT